ncbi:hypothetical protein ACOTH5_31650 [Achromobacter xylosoxidans]|uniref:hypothetical protein n=1 Tax=Alcaligenes xylosoxydans xylosoxydans TaxID=85698 RepID=UPI0004B73CDF|nr:hypothetical protein [Achromobacter xylosoxidans]QQE59165.1 hypothetical protein I6H41_09265 [Achromobacter xylosoxidans]QQV12909.1 hypothetical protein I6I48_24385 [Achromobacter xylosoxidans]
MARKAAQPAPAGDESNSPAASVPPEGAGGESTPGSNVPADQNDGGATINVSEGGTPGDTPAPPPEETAPAESAPSPPPSERESVLALVLHDSIYGKCGEVREFDVALVAALKDAGYIDPHPNAVASAGG